MAGLAAERVLQRLSGVKSISKHPEDLAAWVARCPSHPDIHQSLHVSERADQSVGLHCHAGCDKFTLLTDLGLQFTDLFPPKHPKKEILATYDYYGMDGVLLYQAVRFWPKEFRQRRPDGAGGWAWDMKPFKGKHVPYCLPKLKGQSLVVIVEGEKDADRLWKIGIPATTNIGGAKKWGASETKALKLAGVSRVVILPDNDPPGHAHAELVGMSIKGAGMAVSMIDLPQLPEHGDVSDWLDGNGGTKEDLLALMHVTPYILPSGAPPTPVIMPEVVMPPDALADPLAYTITTTVGAAAAESFRDRYASRLRYDHTRDAWFVWDGHCWRMDRDEEVMRLALQHSRQWGQEVIAAAGDFVERKRWQDYTVRLERRSDRLTMLADARALVPFAGTPEWNRDPWLLGVRNGVVDLRTGALHDGEPTDYISQQVGAAYDPEACCPRWMLFLDEIFMGDEALIEFVHRAVGYSLTGDMREQCFFLGIGGGSNGKSIFLNTLEALLDSYGHRASMRLFVGDMSDFHMAELQGARMILAAETKPGLRLNEHVIKSITGGETQQAERKHEDPFKFRPIGKVWLGVNDLPKVVDDSYGFWRRVRLVPFNQTFTGSADDKQLQAKLVAELPGILAWAVLGTQAWRDEGLAPPLAVMKATDEYQTAEDPLVEFVAERCVLDDDGQETFSALFAAYNGWADGQKIQRGDRLTRRSMGVHLKRRFTPKETTDGTRKYLGVRLVNEGPKTLYDD